MSPPAALFFADEQGMVTLTGVRWRGRSGGSRVTGRISSDVAIFSQPRRLKDEYRVKEFHSTIDGLERFAAFRPLKTNIDEPRRGNEVVVTIAAEEHVSWRSGGFTYTIQSSAPWRTDGRNFKVDSVPYLQTSTSRGATPQEHLIAQWPIRALLLLAFGRKLAWRSHRIKDQQFPVWMASGDAHDPIPVETRMSRTSRDFSMPLPEDHDLALSALHLPMLEARGMRRWTELYRDEVFRRGIEPAVEVINGATRFLEPQLMMLAISLDMLGYYRDAGRASNVPLATHVKRCLDDADLDWPQIGSRTGIAKAIAKLNNDLKHPDRMSPPDPAELSCITGLALIIVRAQVFDLLRLPVAARDQFLRSRDAYHAVDAFKRNGLQIDNQGNVVHGTPSP